VRAVYFLKGARNPYQKSNQAPHTCQDQICRRLGKSAKIKKHSTLAGIWEGNALEDMLWFINSEEHTRSEGFEYRAPSWSWASVHKEIRCLKEYHQAHDLEPLCKILESDCIRTGINAFGEVASGYIRFRSLVLFASLVYENSWRTLTYELHCSGGYSRLEHNFALRTAIPVDPSRS
jgi:hypothetical protein